MTRIEDHPGVLAMLQALASDPHAISSGAAAGFAERAIQLIEALLAENARTSASYDALHVAQCRMEERMREDALRIEELKQLLSDEQDAAVAARNEADAMRQLANDHAGIAASRWQELLEGRSALLKLVMPLHEAVQRADNVEGQSKRDNANCWQMVEVKDLRAIVDYVRALLGGPRA